MDKLRQAAQRALKAMEDGEDRADMIEFSDALIALRAALAEPEQIGNARCPRCWEPITTPRKPLTDEMVKRMKEVCTSMEMRGAFADGWLSAEAAHGIGEQT